MSANNYTEDENVTVGADTSDSLVADDVGEDLIDEAAEQTEGATSEEMPTDDNAAESTEESEPTPEEQIARLQEKIAEGDDQLKRLSADFENFRRRTAKEKLEIGDVVTQNILKDMLPLLDNFERAMGTETTDKEGEGLRKGVEMIFNQFREILAKHGLEVIDTKEAKFDPNFHQAVMRVENDEMEDDTIVAELAKGYIVKGRVIRPSMVQVVANG